MRRNSVDVEPYIAEAHSALASSESLPCSFSLSTLIVYAMAA